MKLKVYTADGTSSSEKDVDNIPSFGDEKGARDTH